MLFNINVSLTRMSFNISVSLTHWDRVIHICASKLTIIGWCQAIIGNNAGILLIVPPGTNFIENLYSRKFIWKCCLKNGGHFVLASMC